MKDICTENTNWNNYSHPIDPRLVYLRSWTLGTVSDLLGLFLKRFWFPVSTSDIFRLLSLFVTWFTWLTTLSATEPAIETNCVFVFDNSN